MADEIEDFDSLNEGEPEISKTEEGTIEEPSKPEYSEAEKKAYARMKVAEAEAKELKTKLKEAEANALVKPPGADPDELRLIAKGLSDEEIEQVRVISKGKGISLPEALKDPLFALYQKDAKEQERKEKAKLGASKGSPEHMDESIKPGMTKEEHEKAWHEATGQ